MVRDGSRDELDEAQAALHALDLLDATERDAFEQRVGSSPALRSEVRALRESAGRLAESLLPLPPPAGLKGRLLARVRAEAGAMPPSIHEQRAADAEWEATGVTGVSVRRLCFDPKSGLATILVRMEPGANYPAHRHSLQEQCLVLEGDLRCGDAEYAKGDFIQADQGSDHPALSTTEGNLLLVVGSRSNEFLLI
jgi:quercetin dioxygenase-like cupin family protein